MINKSDLNFKTKISRSLTDLQNSLDEACRLGLPPNLAVRLNDTDDNYFCEPLDYNFQNDLNYKSASSNLERLIEQQQSRYGKFCKESIDDQQQINSNCVGNRRKVYIDTLRMLADNRVVLPRSHSSDAVYEADGNVYWNANRQQHNQKGVINSRVANGNNVMVESGEEEILKLRQKLVEMNAEMLQMRNELIFRDRQYQSARSGDLQSMDSTCSDIDQQPYEEIKRHLQVHKHREAQLLGQLNEAINTIEEAKLEEMQASMRAEQTKEEYENMKIRFQEVVAANQKKIATQNAIEEQFVQDKIMKMKNEITTATEQLRIEFASSARLADQLRLVERENENLRIQLTALQREKCEQSDQLTTAVTMAHLQMEKALSETGKLQNIIERERRNHTQEKAIIQDEMTELRMRLSVSEHEHLNLAQDKIVLLSEHSRLNVEVQRLTQLHETERNKLTNQFQSSCQQQEERIRELQTELSNKEHLYEAMLSDAESVMRQQLSLINRLKREYGSYVQDMDMLVDRNRQEVDLVHTRLEQTNDELQVSKTLNRDMQQTLDNYGVTLDQMRDSCRNLEEVKCNQDKEIIGHLSRQNDLMKTIELLTIQLQRLRVRIPDCCCGAFDSTDNNIPVPDLSGSTHNFSG